MLGRDLLQPATRNWSVEKSLEDMDQGGVAAAAVSVTNPGLWFGDKQQSRRLARDSNEFMARMVHDHPTRFGFSRRCRCPTSTARCRKSPMRSIR